jgi:hypothetical protein
MRFWSGELGVMCQEIIMSIEENLIGVAVGGLIGFFSAFGMEYLKRRWETKDKKENVSRLLELLYEEVEQLAELLDVDLGLVESEDLGIILEFGRGTEEYDGKLKSVIERLQKNRTIYESQAKMLLDLPGYLPNALVRFYSRLQVNCAKMHDAIISGNFNSIKDLRKQSLNEAEVLKHDLKNAQSDK